MVHFHLHRRRHLSLSFERIIQSIPRHLISLKNILILSYHLRLSLPNGSFPHVSPQNSVFSSLHLCMLQAASFYSSEFDHPDTFSGVYGALIPQHVVADFYRKLNMKEPCNKHPVVSTLFIRRRLCCTYRYR